MKALFLLPMLASLSLCRVDQVEKTSSVSGGRESTAETMTEREVGVVGGHQVDVTRTRTTERLTTREAQERVQRDLSRDTSSPAATGLAGFIAHGFTGAGFLPELLGTALTAYLGHKGVKKLKKPKAIVSNDHRV